jgi:hypothetical protein
MARKVSLDLSFQHFVKITSPFDQSVSAENNDERTPATGPADAGQQAGGSTTGLVHPDHQVVPDKDPEETETILVLPDPPSPHQGKRNSLADAGTDGQDLRLFSLQPS